MSNIRRKTLAEERPDLVPEWSEKNLPLTPDRISAGSSKKVFWKGKCGHEWSAQVKNRAIKGSGCPICSRNIIISGENDFASKQPHLAKEWNKDKNVDFKPDSLGEFSNKEVWWKCSAGHEWKARVADRVRGSGCPYCNRERIEARKEERIRMKLEKREMAAYLRSMQLTAREKERIIREFPDKAVLYYSEKAGQEVRQDYGEQFGLPMQYYYPSIDGCLELASGHTSKRELLRQICLDRVTAKAGTLMVRIIDQGTKANNECECIYRPNDSLDSLETALQEAFTFLGIVVDVNFRRDFREICAVDLPEKKKVVEFLKTSPCPH